MANSGSNKNIYFLIRQFCNEANLPKTVHMLEQETGCFFDMKYFEGLVLSGNWNDAENYLSGFTALQDNEISMKTYFEIRKQKYLEALDRQDVPRALDILSTDLKPFTSLNADLYRDMTLLVTMDDFRKHSSFSMYGDMVNARRNLLDQIKILIIVNPKFQNKLQLPQNDKSRLACLVDQRDQHRNAQLQTHAESSRTVPLVAPTLTPAPVPAMTMHSQPTITNLNITSQGMASQPSQPIQNVDLTSNLLTDLPKTVKRVMTMRGATTSFDFHPATQTLLLVGNSSGEIDVLDIKNNASMYRSAFSIWRREAISIDSLKDIERVRCLYVNRVLWSPDGSLFGVAFSKHIVQLYAFDDKTNCTTQKHLEIDAHHGSVNDLAFSVQEDNIFVITCGDDRLIQVWDARTGCKWFTFQGHTESVHSLCPHMKEGLPFVFSTSRNGEIKAWVYDNIGPRIQYPATHNSCMRMAYTADGKRLFSCGTDKTGQSHMVEWNDSEGYVTHTYNGLSRTAVGIVNFSICKSHFLVAADDHVIKVWSPDNVELLTTISAEGDIPACPSICFNKSGTLLAVSADNNKIKILANDVGQQMLQKYPYRPLVSDGYLSNALRNLANNALTASRTRTENERYQVLTGGSTRSVKQKRPLDNQNRLTTLNTISCQSMRLPSDVCTGKVCALTYTSTGNEIISLAADGVHLLWRWPGTNSTKYGWASTMHAPKLYRPEGGQLMTTELSNGSQTVSPFIALTKNDSYLLSGSGSSVTLFSTAAFQKLGIYLVAPPLATCISYYPQDNNIIAAGLDDSTILIYHIRQFEVIDMLKGHLKRVSGLTFSTRSRVLVSAGVDTQIIVWDLNTSTTKQNTMLEMPTDWQPSETAQTNVQYFQDQIHILVVHETQLAIYETTNLACIRKWTPDQLCNRISHATLSSDNQLVYAISKGGIILIFKGWDLIPVFDVDPSVYLPRNINPSCRVYPQVVAGNPHKTNQFAVGLSDGGVVVIEPPEFTGRWLPRQVAENGSKKNMIIIE